MDFFQATSRLDRRENLEVDIEGCLQSGVCHFFLALYRATECQEVTSLSFPSAGAKELATVAKRTFKAQEKA